MMKIPDLFDSKFANQQFVTSLYTLLVFNLLFAALIYSGLPDAMETPNGAEAGFVFLMIMMYIFMPVLGIGFIFSPAKADRYLPWLGALLLIWGAPINPEPFDVFHRIASDQIIQVQNIEAVIALVLAAWAVYRGIVAYKKIED